jgi:type VI secretion system secreted protein VgrG
VAQKALAAQRQAEYQRPKDQCDKKPQPTGNKCSDLSNEIDHYQNCADWYEWWDNKWLPGRHAKKIQNWRNRVSNLKQQYDKECAPKCQ